jgi:hypothetical protein
MALPSITMDLDLDLKGVLVNLCTDDRKGAAADGLVNHALLTMGKHLKHYEGSVTPEGLLSIRHHTFSEWEAKETYENELELKAVTNAMELGGLSLPGLTCMSDHVILWLYHTRLEKLYPEMPDEDCPRRVYLVGAVALDAVALLEASLSPEAVRPTFVVRHNFAHTSVNCTVLAIKSSSNNTSVTTLKTLRKEYSDAATNLHKFQVENHLKHENMDSSIAVGTSTVGSTAGKLLSLLDLSEDGQKEHGILENAIKMLRFVPSPLKRLAEVNEMVQLQQSVLRTKLYSECKQGNIKSHQIQGSTKNQ